MPRLDANRATHSVSAFVLAIPFAMAFATTPAHADPADGEPAIRLPLARAQRPITLPALVVAPEVDFQIDHRAEGTYGELDVSAAAGLTDDLSVHALVAPLELWAPGGGGLRYGETNRNFGPGAGVSYRFVRGHVELGAILSGRIFTLPNVSGGSVIPGLLFRAHLSESARLDVDPAVTLQFAKAEPPPAVTAPNPVVGDTAVAVPASSASGNAVRVQVPVTLLYNVDPHVDLALRTGLTVFDTSNAKTSTGIPLGFFAGYAVSGAHGPVADIRPFFQFPYLLMPGRAKITNTDQFQIGVELVGYLYL
jgi:hypothetical protein